MPATGSEDAQNSVPRGGFVGWARLCCWSLLVRRHVAFYTVTVDQVLIQRVLHGSMDPDLHLDDE